MIASSADSAARLRKVKITFGLIYFLFMSSRAIFGPFITVFLKERGLSAEMIGIVIGINSIMIILTQPVWGIVTDKIGSTRKTLVICIICQAMFALALLFAPSVLLLSTFFCIYTAFASSEGPLMDMWSLKSVKEAGDGNALGQLKLWGCIGYALCSTAAGLFINRSSTNAILPVFTFVLVGIAAFMFFVRGSDVAGRGTARLRDMQLGRIFKDHTFLIFLAYVFFMQIAHRGSFTFYSLLIKQLGGDTAIVGYSGALMFVSEAVVMASAKKMLGRFKPVYLVMASSFFFMLWHVFLSLSTSPYHVMLSCLMDGPSFALFTIGTLYYLDALAPKEIRTTYQTVAYAVYFGLSGIVGNVASGFMIDRWGYRTMYAVGIGLTFLSTAVFYAVTKVRDRRRMGLSR